MVTQKHIFPDIPTVILTKNDQKNFTTYMDLIRKQPNYQEILHMGGVKIVHQNYDFKTALEPAVLEGDLGRVTYPAHRVRHSRFVPAIGSDRWFRMQFQYGKMEDHERSIKEMFQEVEREWNELPDALKEKCKDRAWVQYNIESYVINKDTAYPEAYGLRISEPITEQRNKLCENVPLPHTISTNLADLELEEPFQSYINSPGNAWEWLYMNVPFTGTVFHTEDYYWNSVNINLGPGDKQWFFVHAADFDKFQQLYKDFHEDKIGRCGCEFHHKLFTPSLSLLVERGIRIYHTVHKAGEVILTMPKAPHQVFNTGYGFAISRNFMTREYLPFAKEANVEYDCPVYKELAEFRKNAELLHKRLLSTDQKEVERLDKEALEKLPDHKWIKLLPQWNHVQHLTFGQVHPGAHSMESHKDSKIANGQQAHNEKLDRMAEIKSTQEDYDHLFNT